jgi:hypothetical protein
MSPEQAAGGVVAEPADWYSFGAVLYEALTGCLPFTGDPLRLLADKQIRDPIPPADLVTGTPEDLNSLCIRLLARRPSDRPGAEAIRAVFGSRPVAGPIVGPFVGRDVELSRLSGAFDRAAAGAITTVYVSGPSGIGKSALVHEFLSRFRGGDALVLEGRCYERESVPYKAFDSLVDALARHVTRLDASEARRCIPTSMSALARIFPAFEPVAATAGDDRDSTPPDPHEQRQRAMTILEELLERLSLLGPLVFFIDDLQWGDLDSAALLTRLIRTRRRMALLLIASFRVEDRETSSCLRALSPLDQEILQIEVGPLEASDAKVLIRALLAEIRPGESGDAVLDQRIARESLGTPLFIHELVRHAAIESDDAPAAPTFEQAIRFRLERLSESARRLLTIVAVAGRPISELTALTAADISSGGRTALAELRAGRLVRTNDLEREEIVTFHDRIREEIVRGLDPASLRSHHLRLARALDAGGSAVPETLAWHYSLAGETSAAATFTAQAAERATAALAFDRAARLYERALAYRAESHSGTDPKLDPEFHSLQVALAEALANAGRGPEAAEAYLSAASGAPRREQLLYRQRAAQQLLHSGHTDRGLELLRSVLAAMDLPFAAPARYLPVRLLLARMRVRLHRLRWRERSLAEIPAETLVRIDAAGSAASGLAFVDIARGAVLQSVNFLLALRAGEPYRVSRALAIESAYASVFGGRSHRRTGRLLDSARAIATRLGSDEAIGLTHAMAAARAWNLGRWKECNAEARQAVTILRERCRGVTWERDTAHIYELDSLRWMGAWAEMQRLLPPLVADARARGDLYAEMILQLHYGTCAAIARDDPAAAREGLRSLDRWSNVGFHLAHLIEFHNQVEIALYCGDGAAALRFVDRQWADLRRSLLLHVQALRIQMRSLRGRAALAAAAERDAAGRRVLLDRARRDARKLRRERARWSSMLADIIDGCICVLDGRDADAGTVFERAQREAAVVDMRLHEAAAGAARGRLVRDVATIAAADAIFEAEQICNRDAYTRVIAPGIS